MAREKSTKKRRQRTRNRRTTGIKQTGTRSLTRNLAIILGVIAVFAAIGGVVLFFANDSKDLHEAPTGEASTIPPTSSDLSSTSATIGTTVGNRIPDVSMRLNNGSTVSTGSLIGEGKPTFLFFFATW